MGSTVWRVPGARGIASRLHVRTGAYPYGNVAAYVASDKQRRKALTVSAEKTPCISAVDTTNFARQIVLDFEFEPVSKQRQRRGLRNEIIEVGAVKLDYHGNVMGEFSQFVQTEFTEGVAFPVRELTGISAVDTAMADPLFMVVKKLNDWIGRYSAQVVCWSGPSTAFDRVPGKAHRPFRISYGLGRPAGVLHLNHERGQPRARLAGRCGNVVWHRV